MVKTMDEKKDPKPEPRRAGRTNDTHSERINETLSEKQVQAREHERRTDNPARYAEEPEGGVHRLESTKRSEMDDLIEEKEGNMAARTPEEMALHDELSKAGKDEKKKDR